jgi:hypothetical protein
VSIKRLAALVGITAAVLVAPAAAQAPTKLQANCKPIEIAGQELFFNERQPSGLWDARVGDTSCHNGRAFLPPHDGHRGVAEATDRYVLLETALGPQRAADFAEPGKGVGIQLQLLDRATGQLAQLTTGRKGIIWAKLNPDGTKAAWAEMVRTPAQAGSLFPWNPYYLGQWELHVADVSMAGLANERAWRHPTDPGFLEAYGWIDDRIVFTSDQGLQQPSQQWDWFRSQLWTIADTLDQPPTRISPPFTYRTWCCQKEQNAYHEFVREALPGAFPEPGRWLLFSVVWKRDLSACGCTDPPYNGLDMWRMHLDGTGRQRVTGFNLDAYANVSAAITDPADPKRLVLSVLNDAQADSIDAWELRLTP